MADEAEPVEVVEEDDPTKIVTEVDADVDADAKKEPDEVKPGTPDKALQRMQQELGNVTRQLAALTEKKEAEGALSEADKAKVAKAQERLQKIRQFVGRPDRDDLPSEVDPVAETVLELSERASDQDKVKAELADTQRRLQLLENQRNWNTAREKYAGLDIDAIWEKAQGDALETLGEEGTPAAVNRVASRYFEDRCDAAKKRLKDDPPANNRESGKSGKYKVGSGQATAPQMSEEDEQLALARSLVVET